MAQLLVQSGANLEAQARVSYVQNMISFDEFDFERHCNGQELECLVSTIEWEISIGSGVSRVDSIT